MIILTRLLISIVILKFVYIVLSVVELRLTYNNMNSVPIMIALRSKWSNEPLLGQYHSVDIVLVAVMCFMTYAVIITVQREKLMAITVIPAITLVNIVMVNSFEDEMEKRFYLFHMMIGFTLTILIIWKDKRMQEPLEVTTGRARNPYRG